MQSTSLGTRSKGSTVPRCSKWTSRWYTSITWRSPLYRKGYTGYDPTLGEWIRDVVFQFFLEHREVINLAAMLKPEELRALAATVGSRR